MDLLRILESRKISLSRFRKGGAAMLAALKINHQMVRAGKYVINPLERNRLRVLVDSYTMLASINIAEEHKPWASIILTEPNQLILEQDNIAAVIIAIWATDE